MKNSASAKQFKADPSFGGRGDSSTGSELKAVEEACREASRTVEPCVLGVSVVFCSFLDPDFSLILAHGKIIQRSTKIPIRTHLARH